MSLGNDYSRRVERYLRNTYGIKRFERGHSGAHPILEFTYNGARRVVTLNRQGHNDGGQLLNMKLQDIRRELGDPPKEERKTKMQLKDMLPPATASTLDQLAARPQVEQASPITGHTSCRVARYKRDSIRLFLPTTLALRLFPAGARAEVVGPDSWRIVPTNASKPKFTRYSDTEHEINFPIEPGDLFGVSPAEAVHVSGSDTLLIRSDPAARKPVNQNLGKHQSKPKQDPAPVTADPVHRDPRSRMLACLREIRDIEALGTHELMVVVNSDGSRAEMQWRPLPGEVIKL